MKFDGYQATVDALDAKIVSLGQDIAAKMKEIIAVYLTQGGVGGC